MTLRISSSLGNAQVTLTVKKNGKIKVEKERRGRENKEELNEQSTEAKSSSQEETGQVVSSKDKGVATTDRTSQSSTSQSSTSQSSSISNDSTASDSSGTTDDTSSHSDRRHDDKEFDRLLVLVINGESLQANQTDDGIQLEAGDAKVELSKEDLQKDPQLRRLISQKISEAVKRTTIDLSGLKLNFSLFGSDAQQAASPLFVNGKSSALLDLAIVKSLASRLRLDLLA